MLSQPVYNVISHALSLLYGKAVTDMQATSVGGGSINQCYRVISSGESFFCKLNLLHQFPGMFQKEKAGLALLASTATLQVPRVKIYAVEAGYQVLLLPWIEAGQPGTAFWQQFGQQLAALHRQTHESFGLDHDNYMGSVPQANRQMPDWISFWIHYRLQPMVERCSGMLDKGHQKMFEDLYRKLPQIFNEEPPALLHGDLWSGNFICSKEQQPWLIDPAVYYGHRSVDLAMTTLFGGFDKTFYDAYHEAFPLPSNYKEQWKVCNLYPLLVHLLLFGKSYLKSIEQTLREFA